MVGRVANAKSADSLQSPKIWNAHFIAESLWVVAPGIYLGKLFLVILMVSGSLNFNGAFFFKCKQLPPAENLEVLRCLLTESKNGKFDFTLK